MSATLAIGKLDIVRGRLTRFGLICLWTSVLAGLIGSLSYLPVHRQLTDAGVTLQWLRPLHLIAGTAWIYLAGLAVVAHYWSQTSDAAAQAVRRARALRFFLWTWTLGAAVVVVCLALHRYGGREYFFASTPSSILFWSGWIPLAWLFIRGRDEPLARQPVYVWMWMSSFGLFTYAFVETHVFLLPYFQSHPLRDMAVEWKSYGTLVGSFNLLVYGSLSYVGTRLNPDERYSRSNLAFALFWVGVFNSFTNYGHHTFHLPQSMIVKWTSFLVSMTEAIILAKVAWDTAGWARRARGSRGWDTVTWLLFATTLWTFMSLCVSMLISIPPLNGLIHGSFVVAAHAMGSMLGIDTMALLAVLAWLHGDSAERARGIRLSCIAAANLGIVVIWSSFLFIGVTDSLRRWQSGVLPSASQWPGWFGAAFALGGLLVVCGVVGLTWRWLLAGLVRVAQPQTETPALAAVVPLSATSSPAAPPTGLPRSLSDLRRRSRRFGLRSIDLAIFAGLALAVLGTGAVLCIAVGLLYPASWLWGRRLLDPSVGIAQLGLLLLGCFTATAASTSTRGAASRRWLMGTATVAAIAFVSVTIADYRRSAERGLAPGDGFHPHPRFTAARFGEAPIESPVLRLAARADAGPREIDAANGRRLFLASCASCHGTRAQGIAGLGKDLRRSPFALDTPDAALVEFIAAGRAATDPANTTRAAMPPRGGNPLLSDDDLRDIVASLRQRQKLAAETLARFSDPSGELAAPNESLPPDVGDDGPIPELLQQHRWVSGAPKSKANGLDTANLANESRVRWQPPVEAQAFFSTYFGVMALQTFVVGLAGAGATCIATRRRSAVTTMSASPLVAVWWWLATTSYLSVYLLLYL